MTVFAIDINDAGLVVANDSALLAAEPGFARIDGGKVVTGEPAKAARALATSPDQQPLLERAQLGARLRRLRLAARAPRSSPTRSSNRCGAKFGNGVDGRRARRAGRLPHGAARRAARPRAGMRHARSRARRYRRGGQRSTVPGAPTRVRRRGLHRASVTLLEQDARSASARRARARSRARRHRRRFRAPHRGSFRALDALRSVHACRDGAAALRPFAGMARAAAARGARRARARVSRREISHRGRARCRSSASRTASTARSFSSSRQHREPGKSLVVQVSDRLRRCPGCSASSRGSTTRRSSVRGRPRRAQRVAGAGSDCGGAGRQ